MPETKKSEGLLVTLNATAASNMAAGDMAGLSGTLVYSVSSATLALTAVIGHSFIGILDRDVSAGDSPIYVWTQGVFDIPLASGARSANLYPGFPVWCDGSGYVTTPGLNGDAAIGTMVNVRGASWGSTGANAYVSVKINPMIFNRTTTDKWGFQRT